MLNDVFCTASVEQWLHIHGAVIVQYQRERSEKLALVEICGEGAKEVG